MARFLNNPIYPPAWRGALFAMRDPTQLPAEEFQQFWPYVDNIWLRQSKGRGELDGVYYCRCWRSGKNRSKSKGNGILSRASFTLRLACDLSTTGPLRLDRPGEPVSHVYDAFDFCWGNGDETSLKAALFLLLFFVHTFFVARRSLVRRATTSQGCNHDMEP